MGLRTDLPVAINYSGGTSSEWLVEAVIQGVIPRPEHVAVFFADTGGEHEWTYDAVAEVEKRCLANGIKFVRCQRPGETLFEGLKNIQDGRKRFEFPSFWVDMGNKRGKLMQRCTRYYKSRVLRKAQAAWLKEIGKPKAMLSWIGFGADEAHRAMKAAARQDPKWALLDFPAIRLRRSRDAQREDLIRWTGRAPKFSMCVFCPFKTLDRWRETSESDLAKAVEVDVAIRDLSRFGIDSGDVFVSGQLIPVDRLRTSVLESSETPSYCDGGHCFL